MIRSLSVALLVLMVHGPAQAWNSIGHLAITKLAYDRLEDGQKTKLFTLLKSHPHYDSFLAVGRPNEVSEVEWVILRSSLWPDWIRPRPKDARGVTKYHRGEEHYINVPFIDPRDEQAFAGKTLVSPDLTNIVCALKQRSNDLATKTAAAEDRAIAICWITHLVGDIHQPMHNVAYFAQNKAFQQGDLGGNKFGIKVNGRKWKLHAYWDELLGEDPEYTDDSPQRQAKIHEQAVTVADNLRNLKLAAQDEERLRKNTTFASWSLEGFELAKTVAYQKTDGTGVLEGVEARFNSPIPDSAPETGDQYAQTARTIAEARAVLAGRRLAERFSALAR